MEDAADRESESAHAWARQTTEQQRTVGLSPCSAGRGAQALGKPLPGPITSTALFKTDPATCTGASPVPSCSLLLLLVSWKGCATTYQSVFVGNDTRAHLRACVNVFMYTYLQTISRRLLQESGSRCVRSPGDDGQLPRAVMGSCQGLDWA